MAAALKSFGDGAEKTYFTAGPLSLTVCGDFSRETYDMPRRGEMCLMARHQMRWKVQVEGYPGALMFQIAVSDVILGLVGIL